MYHLDTKYHVNPVVMVVNKLDQEKINDLEKGGIIKRIMSLQTGGTILLCCLKITKLSLYLNSNPLNEALGRPNYITLTVEVILPELNEAITFSLVDVSKRVWDLELY